MFGAGSNPGQFSPTPYSFSQANVAAIYCGVKYAYLLLSNNTLISTGYGVAGVLGSGAIADVLYYSVPTVDPLRQSLGFIFPSPGKPGNHILIGNATRTWHCYGVESTNPLVCSGHGKILCR